ncbi:MAG: FtsQ-type POTRA domain-containing protein [Deltaproteobacteria bacterium]|jgi:cell division protein FtsQ|nr:FtsQ-type POTRA domain-containing protein [Deltaproteobacteria bacterium]
MSYQRYYREDNFSVKPLGRVKGLSPKKPKGQGSFKIKPKREKIRVSAFLGQLFLGLVKNGPRIVRKLLSGLLLASLILIVGVLLSLLVCWVYFYFSENTFFLIKKHDIRGISRVSREEILRATGLDRPVEFFNFDTVAATNSLKSLPWIEDASITRAPLPDGVTITVTEYKPKAIVNLEQLYYLDALGQPFKNLLPGENPDFPIVSGFTLDELLSGGPLTQDAMGEVFELIDILGRRMDEWKVDNISEIRFDPDIGISMFTRYSGLEIKLGFGPYSEKIVRLAKVMDYLKAKKLNESIVYVNLECIPRVTVRYAKGKNPKPGPNVNTRTPNLVNSDSRGLLLLNEE